MPPGIGGMRLIVSQNFLYFRCCDCLHALGHRFDGCTQGCQNVSKSPCTILSLVQIISVFQCPKRKHKTLIFDADGARKAVWTLDLDVLGDVLLLLRMKEISDAASQLCFHSPKVMSPKLIWGFCGSVTGLPPPPEWFLQYPGKCPATG
jgi:ATP-binding protein involved in chromosome partitioning